ncbi:Uncharacterized membrane protein YtjA, UPF0391 family [Faunimonas pinastri]|uniref:UPF0391 membrane protein SAMN05216548_10547 n=2 Tax=Faunimonas pinastri TaxID=1855383 RepID=A0A1H9GI66_9HYPH|nr:Uncharacterized membrane protein YtjA, UPF0391 family [Faunimonas pinastri]
MAAAELLTTPGSSLKSTIAAKRAIWGDHMLKYALIFFVISIIAGAFGFTGVARGAAGIARILFFLFLIIFIVLLILALTAGAHLAV